jgi:C4-dicarboxylate-specific signal transduction histidine kinase
MAQRSQSPPAEAADGPAADFAWRTDATLRIERLDVLDGSCPTDAVLSFRGARLDRLVERLPSEAERAALTKLLRDRAELRNVTLPLVTREGKTVFLVLRARPMQRNGAFQGYSGTGQYWDERPFDTRQRQELVDLLAKAESARQREHGLRRESEALLASLQALIQRAPLAVKCRAIFAAFAELLAFDDAFVVRRAAKGRLTTAVATNEAFAGLVWPDSEHTQSALGGTPVVLDNIEPGSSSTLPEPLAGRVRSALLASLKIGKEPALLIAVHREPGHFERTHLKLMQRLGLIATQAFNEEDQKSLLANSSKLSSLGEMMTTIAHELNQPLTVISMAAQNAQVLMEAGAAQDQVAKKVDRIVEQVDRAAEIVKAIKTFAYPDRPASQTEPVEAETVIRGLAVLTEGSLSRRSIDFEIRVPTGCRPLRANPARLQQVLINLVTNARDAIEQRKADGKLTGRGRIVAEVVDDPADPLLSIRVADNGGGVPPDLLELIFDPFFTLKEAGKGNGLGLAICRTFLDDMNGSIEVRNEGEGAVFEVRLPAYDAPPGRGAEEPAAAAGTSLV